MFPTRTFLRFERRSKTEFPSNVRVYFVAQFSQFLCAQGWGSNQVVTLNLLIAEERHDVGTVVHPKLNVVVFRVS